MLKNIFIPFAHPFIISYVSCTNCVYLRNYIRGRITSNTLNKIMMEHFGMSKFVFPTIDIIAKFEIAKLSEVIFKLIRFLSSSATKVPINRL